ncbi:transporter substrate-binding domain-containing protein [Oscillatoria sp. FACHB-1406]|nr:transporter substrate-binding domain-containing protein [Oscillatoria sp. FACHB-1406]
MSMLAAIALLGSPALAPRPLRAASLAEIVDRGKLIVGVKDNLRPLGFRDEAGNLQGLEIDIARQLAAEILGSPEAVEFRPLGNLERLNALSEGRVDVVIANLSQTASRDRFVNFSRYYYLNSTAFLTLNPNLQRLGDLSSKKIALLQGSSTIAVVRHELSTATLVPVQSYQEARSLLESGKADAFAADLPVLVGWVQENPRYQLLRDRIPGESLSIALPKGLAYSTLYLRINQLLSNWQISGWLKERIERWGLNSRTIKNQ